MLVDVELQGEGLISALVKEVQHHPVSGDLIHVDLQKMDADVAIQVEINIELVGEAAGAKAGGTLDLVMHTVEVECLPGDLIEAIEIDISDLEIGSVLHVSDLDLGTQFKVLSDTDAIIASVAAPRAEEEDEDEAVEGAVGTEPEVITEKKADEE
jgi:large subunit ribosomal protein L25